MTNRRSTLAQSRDAERLVAKRLGGKRIHSTGLPNEPDVDLGFAACEVKHRRIPRWIVEGMEQAERLDTDLPVLVLVDKPGHTNKPARMLVVLDWRDWVDQSGKGQSDD